MWTEPYEKPLIQNIMQKRVMNGSVVPLIDKPKIDEINAESERLRSVFYEGDKLTDLEVDIQRMYLNKKMEKQIKYK
jgi:hypothetical protein